METITKEQYQEFLQVQQGGLYNMFDIRARQMTSLTKDQWIYIMSNYGKLEKKYK